MATLLMMHARTLRLNIASTISDSESILASMKPCGGYGFATEIYLDMVRRRKKQGYNRRLDRPAKGYKVQTIYHLRCRI